MSIPADRIDEALAGRYAVERVLGEGGMATVYLAHDLRHARHVAIKVLRPELATAVGAERFLEEIRTTAGLQHPHIVPVHDSGTLLGTVYYVMAYVRGESLRERLVREGALPVADAVRVAREVAEALDYAHRHGIAHRDIKPENILLHEGRAVVADFGVALALGRSADARLTATGLSVGTPQYMSPEQAMGERTLTPRADLFALGAVLYEMLAGEPPFTGPTAQAVVTRTLTEEPRPLRALRPSVPEAVARAVARAMEKLPADRFATAAEFAAALGEGAAATGTAPGAATPDAPGALTAAGSAARVGRPERARVAVLAPAVVATALLAAALTRWLDARPAAPAPLVRAQVTLDRGELLEFGFAPMDLSRDGRLLAYVADTGGRTMLVVRPLADSTGRRLGGTDGARDPFFSPDGEWIGFFVGERLLKVPVGGGAPAAVATVPGATLGASWGDDGSILVATTEGLLRFGADGGVPESVRATPPAAPAGAASGGPLLRDPALLPGGRAALITADSMVALLDLARGTLRPLVRGSRARFVPPAYLAYDDGEGRVRLVEFDRRSGRTAGASVPLLDAFRTAGAGAALFAVSDAGRVAYVPSTFRRRLVRVTPDGRESVITPEPNGFRFPRVSPDGRTIAVTVDPRPSSVWLVDAARGVAARLTFGDRHEYGGTWSADGRRLAFMSRGIEWIPVEGGVSRPFLAPGSRTQAIGAATWLRDGRILGYQGRDESWRSTRELIVARPGDSAVTVLTAAGANEDRPALSPDERWLAYTSDATGTVEVYVRPFERPGAPVAVTAGGGTEPHWAPRGDALLFRRGTRILAVRVRTGAAFTVLGDPHVVAAGTYDFAQTPNWDVAPDGSLVLVRSDPPMGSEIHLLLGWDPARTLRSATPGP